MAKRMTIMKAKTESIRLGRRAICHGGAKTDRVVLRPDRLPVSGGNRAAAERKKVDDRRRRRDIRSGSRRSRLR